MKKYSENELRKQLKNEYNEYVEQESLYTLVWKKYAIIIGIAIVILLAIYFVWNSDMNTSSRRINSIKKEKYKIEKKIDVSESDIIYFSNTTPYGSTYITTSGKEEKYLKVNTDKSDFKCNPIYQDGSCNIESYFPSKSRIDLTSNIKKFELINVTFIKYVLAEKLNLDSLTIGAYEFNIVEDSNITNLQLETDEKTKNIIRNSKIKNVTVDIVEGRLYIINSEVDKIKIKSKAVGDIIIKPLKNQSVYVNGKLLKKSKEKEQTKLNIDIKEKHERNIQIK